MLKKAVLLLMVFLLIGCATTTQKYDYAEYNSSLTTGMSFYSQYEIVHLATTKKGDVLVVAPFLADSNNYLPGKVVKLHLGMQVNNPNRIKFAIWVNQQFIAVDKKGEFKTLKLVHVSQGLPEEFISINLPYNTNIHSKVEFQAEVISNGKVIHESSKAVYRIKGVIKPKSNINFNKENEK